MMLKRLPEDFKVEEVNEFDVSSEKKGYKLYILKKKELETFSLLRYLSGKNNIPASEFGLAGLKDRHAVTTQYFTIPSAQDIKTLHEKNFDITFLGYVDQKIRFGCLKGNKFEITVRDVKKGELDGINRKAENIEVIGVPNYFDSQRFGSVINNNFIAKCLVKKDYEPAVKIYLTKFPKSESSRIKQEKRLIAENWDDISGLNIKNRSLAGIIWAYKKNRSWFEAYKKIPANIREIIISAYQSYLWNECVKHILISRLEKKRLYTVKYSVGSLIFYKSLSEDEASKLPQTFKTVSDNIKPTGLELEAIRQVLEREGVGINDFNIRKTGNFFKTHERSVLLKPQQFSISQPCIDEINDKGRKNRFKILLSFTLPKGSYATIITKRIFNR